MMILTPFKDIHNAVKVNYLRRLIIYTAEFILVYSVFHHHKEPLPYWLIWLVTYLVWPSLAFVTSVVSRNPKKTEKNHALFEAVLVGAYFALLKFDLWACLAFCSINLLLYTMIGGLKFFLKALGIMGVSCVLTLYFIPGFRAIPKSSTLTIVISIILVLVAIAVMGIFAHITNKRLSLHRRELKEKQEQIVSSLKYARNIQNSLMAVPEAIHKELPRSFIIWEPRDIVGGDIYYTHFSDDEFYISVIDCTGHGVPGALLSMVASSILQRIVRAEKLKNPSDILKRLNHIVKLTLYQDSLYTVSDDGMDVAVCVVHKKSRRLTYAGAKIPLLIVKDGKSQIIKGDKQSVGYRLSDENFPYKDHEVQIEEGASFYLFSDGIPSQTGGEENMMFGVKRLRSLLEDLSGKPFDIQKEVIMKVFSDYHKEMKRMDDITLLGFSLDDPE